MIRELMSKSCLWTVRGLGLGTDLKKTASGSAFLAKCLASNSRLRSDICWNRSSSVRIPPVFAAGGGPDGATGAVPSRSTDGAGATGFGAEGPGSAVADGFDNATAAVASGSTDEVGTASGGRGAGTAGAAPVFAAVDGRGTDKVIGAASLGCTDGATAGGGFEEVPMSESVLGPTDGVEDPTPELPTAVPLVVPRIRFVKSVLLPFFFPLFGGAMFSSGPKENSLLCKTVAWCMMRAVVPNGLSTHIPY